jgi:hypothetical protein
MRAAFGDDLLAALRPVIEQYVRDQVYVALRDCSFDLQGQTPGGSNDAADKVLSLARAYREGARPLPF